MKEKQTNPAVCQKTAKRLLALLLTFCMLISTLCLPAFATESEASLSEKTATADDIKALLEDDYSLNTAGGVDNAQTVIYMGDNCYRAQATGATGTHANTYCKFLEDNGYTTRYVTADKYVGSHLGASGACNQQYANDTYLVTVFWDSVNEVLTVTMEPLPADADLRAEYLSVFKPASTEKVCEPVAIQMGLDVDYKGDPALETEDTYNGAYEQTAGADTPDDTSDDVYVPVDIRAGMSYVFRLSDGSFVIYDGGSHNAKAYDGINAGDGKTVLRKNMYRLLDILNTYAVDKTDIRIAAWIITHPHTDHYKLFEQVVEEMYDPQNSHYDEYANITIERVITNYPSYEQLDNCTNAANSNGACDVLTEEGLANRRAALATCEENGVYLYKAHAGQTYYLADAEIAILYTEEIALTPSGNADCSHESGDQSQGNRLSVISQLTLPVNGYGVKFMMTGDAEGDVIAYVNGVYGTALKSDFVQAPHHGNNDTQTTALETFYATNVQAPYLMVPTSEDWWAGNAVNADDADATLLTDSGNYTKAYSNTTGVTTFVAGDVSHEFELTVSEGVLSVASIPLFWTRGDIMTDLNKAEGDATYARGTYKLINDITLGTVFKQYVKSGADIGYITLDGMGHTITYGGSAQTGIAKNFLDTTYFYGAIRNLTIDGYKWSPSGAITSCGILATRGYGTFENVHMTNFSADFAGCTRGTTNAYVGGFLGIVEAGAFTATNCSISGKAFDSNDGETFAELANLKTGTVPVRFAGFVGCAKQNVTLTNCVSSVDIINRDSNNKSTMYGGLIASVDAAITVDITRCTYNGTIASDSNAGGFIGITSAAATINIKNSVNNGTIITPTPTEYAGVPDENSDKYGAGGFVGYVGGSPTITIDGCVNKGNVSAYMSATGGFVGNVDSAATVTVKNSYNYGDVSGARVGGILGRAGLNSAGANITVENCQQFGAVAATTCAGGLIAIVAESGAAVTVNKNLIAYKSLTGDGSKSVAIGSAVASSNEPETPTTVNLTNNVSFWGTNKLCNNGALTTDEGNVMLEKDDVAGVSGGALTQTNEGAGIRIVNDDKGTGLRFKVTMDATSYADLQKIATKYGAANVKVGALIVPTSYVDAANGIFTKESVTNAKDMSGTADRFDSNMEDGGAFYYASLVNLYEQHYDIEYTCVSYYSFSVDGGTTWFTVYGDAVTRTISDVADAFLADQTVDFSQYTPEQLALVNAYAAAND